MCLFSLNDLCVCGVCVCVCVFKQTLSLTKLHIRTMINDDRYTKSQVLLLKH